MDDSDNTFNALSFCSATDFRQLETHELRHSVGNSKAFFKLPIKNKTLIQCLSWQRVQVAESQLMNQQQIMQSFVDFPGFCISCRLQAKISYCVSHSCVDLTILFHSFKMTNTYSFQGQVRHVHILVSDLFETPNHTCPGAILQQRCAPVP